MTDPIPSPSLPALLTDEEAMRVMVNACDSLSITRVHEVAGGKWKSQTICDDAGLLELARAVEAAVLAKSSPAPSAPTIDAPGLVFMVAYGEKTEVRGMFDTAEQAHAFVKRFKEFVPRDDITTLGGGAPGDHNGVKAAAAPTAPTMHIECRECDNCGHIGINDSHDTDAACSRCDWSGPSPKEDRCPACKREGTMSMACPKCSNHYRTIAECAAAAPTAATADSAEMVVLRELVAVRDSKSTERFSPTWYKRHDDAWTRARALVAQKEKKG